MSAVKQHHSQQQPFYFAQQKTVDLSQQERQALYARLRHAGVMVTDGTPQTLAGRLNRLYLSLCRAGRL